MTEREALLEAVCADPSSDLPRLVFADWLDDHGDPDRAEFIRVQCRIAAQERAAEPRSPELTTRESELKGRVAGWLAAELPIVPGVFWQPHMRRGFAEMAGVESDAVLIRPDADWYTRVPIIHLGVSGFQGQPGFAAWGGLTRLRSLSLHIDQPLPGIADELLSWTEFRSDLLLSIWNERRCFAGRTRELNRAFGLVLMHELAEPSVARPVRRWGRPS